MKIDLHGFPINEFNFHRLSVDYDGIYMSPTANQKAAYFYTTLIFDIMLM